MTTKITVIGLISRKKKRQQASNGRNYKLCDQLTDQMADLKLKKKKRM